MAELMGMRFQLTMLSVLLCVIPYCICFPFNNTLQVKPMFIPFASLKTRTTWVLFLPSFSILYTVNVHLYYAIKSQVKCKMLRVQLQSNITKKKFASEKAEICKV